MPRASSRTSRTSDYGGLQSSGRGSRSGFGSDDRWPQSRSGAKRERGAPANRDSGPVRQDRQGPWAAPLHPDPAQSFRYDSGHHDQLADDEVSGQPRGGVLQRAAYGAGAVADA
eukprot:2625222-Alexandrium_andersonii.AAC.1